MVARYPALVRYALPPRHRRSRPAVIAAECEFFVPELSGAEMPEALRCTARMGWGDLQTVVYRYFDGGLYSRHPRGIADFLGDLENPFNASGVFRVLHDAIRAHLRALPDRSACWPTGIDNALVNGLRSGVLERVASDSHLVTFDPAHAVYADEFACDLAHWHVLWLEQARLFVISDGSVWKRAPEPFIRVDMDFSQGHVSLATDDAFGTVRGLVSNPRQTRDFHFPVTALDEALSFAAANLPAGAPIHGHEEMAFELESPRYLTKDAYSMDILNAARRLLRDLDGFRNAGGENALDSAMSSLEAAIRSCGETLATDPVAEGMDALLDAADVINVATGVVPGRGIRSSQYRLHLEKWLNRPVAASAFGGQIGSPAPEIGLSVAMKRSRSDTRIGQLS